MKSIKGFINEQNANVQRSSKVNKMLDEIKNHDITAWSSDFFKNKNTDMLKEAQKFADKINNNNATEAFAELIYNSVVEDAFEYPDDYVKFFIMGFFPELVEYYGFNEDD